MQIVLTKLTDERHALEVLRADGSRERVELETRSVLFHDFTHFALEQAARIERGFFGALAAGATLRQLSGRAGESAPDYDGERLQIERAVAVLQGLAKAPQDPAALHARIVQMLAIQEETPPAWFTVELVQQVAERLRQLVGEWKATRHGSSLELFWTKVGR